MSSTAVSDDLPIIQIRQYANIVTVISDSDIGQITDNTFDRCLAGEDSFTFKANDRAIDSNIAKFIITVDEDNVIIVDPETSLGPLDFWWANLLGLLLLLLFFLRPNLKYALVDKEGKEKVVRRHIFANGKDDLYVDLNDKWIEGLVAIDLVEYKQLVFFFMLQAKKALIL
ncbi:MAG: hypothetical protein FD133_1235 [Erysipelotrichaceae bacterium]|nr:MAG: hypothetical protein FD179_450 [Erysipelotrichaceae bacterium]TXT17767.1 MAG: hypothetical protein FD133_1235 [Erysipelotrichaceae bacterium]